MKLEVIPQPRQVKHGRTGYRLTSACRIRVSDTTADRFAAMLLQEGLRQTHGIECDIHPVPLQTEADHELWLSSQKPTGSLARDSAGEILAGQQAEGYRLTVDKQGAHVAAQSETGLYYGVQTLIQLAEQAQREQAEIPGLAIADYPSFAMRSRYIEGYQVRGTIVLTRSQLEKEIRLQGRHKLNYLIIEIYNLFPFESFPGCADEHTLSRSDWQALKALARAHHVVLMPSMMSLAQAGLLVWNCEEGKPYREATAEGLICPSRPANAKFLQGIYKELLEFFSDTPYLSIGCSEVKMAWIKRYCPRCQKRLDQGETEMDLYCQHVNRCATAVEAAGREVGRPVRPWIWADPFYMNFDNQRWEGIEKISKNVVMGHWLYWSSYTDFYGFKGEDYDGIDGLLERGFDVAFLSASYSFNTFIHDLSPDEPRETKESYLWDSGIYNIAGQPRWAAIYNRKGHPGRVLGGGCATFSQHDIRCWDTTWFAYLLQAEYSWGDPSRPLKARMLKEFTGAFAAAFYGPRDTAAVRLIAKAFFDLNEAKTDIERNNFLIRDIIGEYDVQNPCYDGNDLTSTLGLIDELLEKKQDNTLLALRLRAEGISKTSQVYCKKLAAVAGRVRNPESLGYLIDAAHKMRNHATRTLYLLDQQETLKKSRSSLTARKRAGLRQEIEALKVRLADLRGDTQVIADKVDKLTWLHDGTGYHRVLASLVQFDALLNAALD